MEYVYASLLLHHAGKEITEENLKKILEAAGINVDEVRLKALVAALKEVNIDEAIKAAVPAAPTMAVPAAAPGQAEEERKEEKEEKKEEKKEEAAEEEIAAGLAGLFG
ncbi:MAG: 50S ribosomal protein P1 [Thermoprotei archaeon]|nr:MAG: 50S ribosomal protein P1 [Thermoprotei archaeon]